MWIETLHYSVEHFDRPHGDLIELLARLRSLDMAAAAYRVACATNPDKFIVLARKAQILKRSDEPDR